MQYFMKKGDERKISRQIAWKGGTYSLTITVVVLAILIAVNVFVSVLPASMTKLDISSSKLYSITSNTKVVVNALDQDVTIYWLVQSDEEDSVIENLLAKYESLSEYLTVVKKNPDTYPTFAQQYTDGTVTNNDLIVECGDRYRYISYSDIYLTEIDYSTYSQVYSFDGEGAITSAIDYVVSEELPQVYVLEGHGEEEVSGELQEQMEKENMELQQFSLLNEEEIPEDADCVLIYAPSSDISEKEKDILADYVADGGKLMVMAGPVEDGALTNLSGLLADYGVETAEGIVVEGDRGHYAFGTPAVMLPNLESHSITDPLSEANYYVIMPIAQGLQVGNTDKGVVTELLTTSESAYSKTAGYAMETYEKEDGDTDGPFALAVAIETNDGEGQMIWVASSDIMGELYNAYSSGANLDFTMNALSSLIGEREAVAIRSKSLGYNYLTIDESTSSMLKTIMIGILPLSFTVLGVFVIVERRKRRNEES